MDYTKLVEVYEFLGATASRLKKVDAIARLMVDAPAEELPRVALLVQGTVFPSWSEQDIGIANQLMIKAISHATGFRERDVVSRFAAAGDLGTVAEALGKKKQQRTLAQEKLTVKKVFENVLALAGITGKGTVERKLSLVTELISFATPQEAKYVVRTTLGTLRVGVAEGIVRDAVAKAFFSDIVWGLTERTRDVVQKERGKFFVLEEGFLEELRKKGENVSGFVKRNTVNEKMPKEIEKINFWKRAGGPDYLFTLDEKRGAALKKRIVGTVEMAWFLRPDYGEIARIAKERGFAGLRAVSLSAGKPYHVLLAEKAPSLQEGLAKWEHPALEWKYDGARVSIQKSGERIWLFTRRLEDVTQQFPEVIAWARTSIRAHDAMVEGEMVGFRKGKPMPFQFLSQRIKRKHDIEKIAKEVPVQVHLFDIVYLKGKNLFQLSARERWALLKKTVKPLPGKIGFAKHMETTDIRKAEAFYNEALKAHQEGLMVKNLDAAYQPGRRVGYWLKVKPTMENLDLVIIGAVWGTGKRAGWLGSFALGCRDRGMFPGCGMIGTGLKEKGEGVTLKELTRLLRPLIEKRDGNTVRIKPRIVVEVAYEEIQKSPTYASGFALRFPRVVRLRTADKSASQADTLERVKRLWRLQKGMRA